MPRTFGDGASIVGPWHAVCIVQGRTGRAEGREGWPLVVPIGVRLPMRKGRILMTIAVTAAEANQLKKKLAEHFGFRRFRPGQVEAVASAMSGQDTLVIMPTGSGKSVCFQLPALELHGTTVVVSPWGRKGDIPILLKLNGISRGPVTPPICPIQLQ
ncbi:hypothetical protein BH23PLA1_BH23PLA1_36370 [soil metagenome]